MLCTVLSLFSQQLFMTCWFYFSFSRRIPWKDCTRDTWMNRHVPVLFRTSYLCILHRWVCDKVCDTAEKMLLGWQDLSKSNVQAGQNCSRTGKTPFQCQTVSPPLSVLPPFRQSFAEIISWCLGQTVPKWMDVWKFILAENLSCVFL